MAIKDYKSPAPVAHPPTDKKAKSKNALKKTTIGFIVGFLLGALTVSGFFINYLDDNNAADIVEQAIPDAVTDEQQSPPTPTSAPEEQTIDYQFYEQLENFKLLDPVQDIPANDETDQHLFLNGTDKATAQDRKPVPKDKNGDRDETPTRYILQAGTFGDSREAQTQRRKIIDLGYKETHIFQSAYDNKQYYRVWLGPYGNLREATAAGNALKSAHIEVMLRHNLRKFNPREK